MKRFAIKLTHGDDVKILEVFDDKPAAMAAGTEHRKTIPRDKGLLSLILAEFNDDGNIVGNAYQLLEVIR